VKREAGGGERGGRGLWGEGLYVWRGEGCVAGEREREREREGSMCIERSSMCVRGGSEWQWRGGRYRGCE